MMSFIGRTSGIILAVDTMPDNVKYLSAWFARGGRPTGISSESGSEELPSYAVLSDFSKGGQFTPKGQPSKNLKKSQKNLFSMTAPTVPDFIPGSSKTSTTAGGWALCSLRNK
jgi:hypothetical protein